MESIYTGVQAGGESHHAEIFTADEQQSQETGIAAEFGWHSIDRPDQPEQSGRLADFHVSGDEAMILKAGMGELDGKEEKKGIADDLAARLSLPYAVAGQ
jgi:hypothetical protein